MEVLFFSIFIFVLAVLSLHCCEGFSGVAASGGCSLVVVQASHCSGLSLPSVGLLARGLQNL